MMKRTLKVLKANKSPLTDERRDQTQDECHSRWIVVKILAVYIATFLSLVD